MSIPVKPEDFTVNFGEQIEPLTYFANTINRVKVLAAGSYLWFVADDINGIIYTTVNRFQLH